MGWHCASLPLARRCPAPHPRSAHWHANERARARTAGYLSLIGSVYSTLTGFQFKTRMLLCNYVNKKFECSFCFFASVVLNFTAWIREVNIFGHIEDGYFAQRGDLAWSFKTICQVKMGRFFTRIDICLKAKVPSFDKHLWVPHKWRGDWKIKVIGFEDKSEKSD